MTFVGALFKMFGDYLTADVMTDELGNTLAGIRCDLTAVIL
jgi:hypothetical protein